jgi:hypothetical protein
MLIAGFIHRLCGIVGSGVEEPNAIVQLDTGARTVPNARATEVALYDGLVANSVTVAKHGFRRHGGDRILRAPDAGRFGQDVRRLAFWMRYEHYTARCWPGRRSFPTRTFDKMNRTATCSSWAAT